MSASKKSKKVPERTPPPKVVYARPFVKWAGGKKQTLPDLLRLIPEGRYGTYYEPFLGGGALFFALAGYKRFDTAVLNDSNQELMAAFKVVRDFPDALMRELTTMETAYNAAPETVYYQWRSLSTEGLNPIVAAARTIFLNKTGFNGLFRVNKRGGFNSPWGKRAVAKTYDKANIQACSAALDDGALRLLSLDFEGAVRHAVRGDLVYFDPPYIPLNSTANFTGYTNNGFTTDDHKRLANTFRSLVDRGVTVILSNSHTKATLALYDGFEIHNITAKRAINSNGAKRGPIREVVVIGGRIFAPGGISR